MPSRTTALRVRNLLDNWVPPALRDSRWFMAPLLRVALGREWRTFAEFKPRGFALTAEEFSGVYAGIGSAGEVQGETDLNDACTAAILERVEGSVLDVGCGRGYLAERLTEVTGDVTGCDIVLYPGMAEREGLRFVEGTSKRSRSPTTSSTPSSAPTPSNTSNASRWRYQSCDGWRARG
jgi:SAM-dependent methyltransferase